MSAGFEERAPRLSKNNTPLRHSVCYRTLRTVSDLYSFMTDQIKCNVAVFG